MKFYKNFKVIFKNKKLYIQKQMISMKLKKEIYKKIYKITIK